LIDSAALAKRLAVALRLASPPIAIRFAKTDVDAAPFGALPAPPNEAGRTGTVPAGCVFWMKSTDRTFATTAADHANCSVGSFTHGFIDVAAAATRDDVEAVLAAGWVDEAAVAALPHVRQRHAKIVYGPLAAADGEPDVVLVRVDGLGLMTLQGAIAGLRIEGRPQCHIVALAKEEGAVAASVGCALSRARTGMPATEMTCAIPGSRLRDVVEKLEATAALDKKMANYAGGDARRFEPSS